MTRHRFGEMPQAAGKLLDLGSKRLGVGERPADRRLDLVFHNAEAAVEFGHLPGEIARAASNVRDLIADLGAVVLAAGDSVVDREPAQHAKPDKSRVGDRDCEAEMQRHADRCGNEHHAEGDEKKALMRTINGPAPPALEDAKPARGRPNFFRSPLPGAVIRARLISVSISAASPQVR